MMLCRGRFQEFIKDLLVPLACDALIADACNSVDRGQNEATVFMPILAALRLKAIDFSIEKEGEYACENSCCEGVHGELNVVLVDVRHDGALEGKPQNTSLEVLHVHCQDAPTVVSKLLSQQTVEKRQREFF